MTNILVLILLSAVVGVCVGMLSGMLGIGGGTILVPVFRLFYGLDAVAATATSLFTIIPTSLAGSLTHVRKKACIPKVGIAAGIGGACTSWLGALLADNSPAWCVMVAAACVIAYSSISMFKKAIRMKPAQTTTACAQQMSTPVESTAQVFAWTRKRALQSAGIGAIAGVLSGYVGVGGGFIMVPLFLGVLGLPMKKASGTSLIAVSILAIPATVLQFALGNVNVIVGLCIVIGSIPGATLGARLQKYIPERTLRFIFGGFLILAAVMLIVREVGFLG